MGDHQAMQDHGPALQHTNTNLYITSYSLPLWGPRFGEFLGDFFGPVPLS